MGSEVIVISVMMIGLVILESKREKKFNKHALLVEAQIVHTPYWFLVLV